METTVGTPVEIGKATLRYGNLPVELSEAAGTLHIGGTHKDQFGMKVTRNEPGEMELTLTYAPTKPTTYGMHTARITIDPQVEGLTAKYLAQRTGFRTRTEPRHHGRPHGNHIPRNPGRHEPP